MSSMRLEQGQAPRKRQLKKPAADPVAAEDYPSTRYFQVHFQHLYEVVDSLRAQVLEANRQLAAQNQILRHLLQEAGGQPCPACQREAPPRRVAEEGPPPYNPG